MNMRKLLALFMALTMLLCASVFASAETAETDVAISFDSSDVKLAEEFDITVSVTNNKDENFYGGEFSLEYDSSRLSFVSVVSSFEDDCPWETEMLYSTAGSCHLTSYADLSKISNADVASCGIAPGEKIDFVFTFKAIGGGEALVSVVDAIFMMGEFFEDVDLAEAETTVSIAYPAKVSGVSPQLGAGIYLSFSGLIPEEYEGAQMCFAQELYTDDGVVLEDAAYVDGTSAGTTGDYNGQTLPKYDFLKGVNPDRLGDEVYAYIVYNGMIISETKSYSVLKYCNHVFTYGKALLPTYTDEQYEALETLLCDILKYGEAAQLYTEYKTSSLVTDLVLEGYTLTPSEFKTIDSTDFKLTEGNITDPKFSAVSLSLGSNFRLSYKVNASSIAGLKIKVSYNTGTNRYYYYADESSLVPTDTDGVYYLYVRPNATGVDHVYTLTIYDADGNQGRTVSYSVKSYVCSKQDDGSTLGEIVRTLYNYGKSVANYAELIK